MTTRIGNIIKITCTSLLLVLLIVSGLSSKDQTESTGNYLDQFHARRTAEILSKENIKDIEFIEIIVKNFGYIDNKKLRKEYWKANLLVTAGNVIKAKLVYEENRKNINLSLKKISMHYKRDTLKILEECTSLLSAQKIETFNNNDLDKKDKLIRNQLRLKVAFEELKNAENSYTLKQYRNSINLYRVVKRHAISVLKDMSNKRELKDIMNKYKVHIVDNRHEIFKKG